MDAYRRAWTYNDPADIRSLFAEDAVYRTEPYATPWRGRHAIVDFWLERKDEPGDTEFTWHPLAVTDDVAIVVGETRYRTPPRTFSNLWVIRLDPEGRCTEFTEWWMERPSSAR
jgi:ketosteroid isomerase-like protein